jgi:ABC-2 type transport system ATP-binding protein
MLHENILRVENLVKIFYPRGWWKKTRSFTAVDHISFELKKGEILGLLGPNGAGKTTTLHMLLDILEPTQGRIIYFDLDLRTHRSEILQKVGFATTYMRLPVNLTIIENLTIYGKLYNLSSQKIKSKIEELLTLFGMWNFRNKPVGELSAGQTSRVMLAKAFLPEPSVVLLDEPTAALDPDIAHEIRRFVLEQKDMYNTSILLASHNMQEVTEICDRVVVLKAGRIIATDTPENLAASVATAYVSLIVGDGLKRTIDYAQKHNLPYTVYGRYIEIEVNERNIAQFLSGLAEMGVYYTQIWIDRPTLETYFLQIATQEEHKPRRTP